MMEEGTGQTTGDSSGNELDATLHGDAHWEHEQDGAGAFGDGVLPAV